MMLIESHQDFFTRDIRVVRFSIAGSFSVAGEGHRKHARFPMELPLTFHLLYRTKFSQLKENSKQFRPILTLSVFHCEKIMFYEMATYNKLVLFLFEVLHK
jgi:hypothetical protein